MALLIALLFQSTLPLWGATRPGYIAEVRNDDFNPRSPCGERLYNVGVQTTGFIISIHAPPVGSDSKDAQIWGRIFGEVFGFL